MNGPDGTMSLCQDCNQLQISSDAIDCKKSARVTALESQLKATMLASFKVSPDTKVLPFDWLPSARFITKVQLPNLYLRNLRQVVTASILSLRAPQWK